VSGVQISIMQIQRMAILLKNIGNLAKITPQKFLILDIKRSHCMKMITMMMMIGFHYVFINLQA
jgi:hypothetical protein